MPLAKAVDQSSLPPAVPTYTPDVRRLHEYLGQVTAHMTALAEEMQRRAVEANQLHDDLTRVQAELAEAQATIGDLRSRLEEQA